jgi:hypothetical protein
MWEDLVCGKKRKISSICNGVQISQWDDDKTAHCAIVCILLLVPYFEIQLLIAVLLDTFKLYFYYGKGLSFIYI